jgi:hypothetical protein
MSESDGGGGGEFETPITPCDEFVIDTLSSPMDDVVDKIRVGEAASCAGRSSS